MEPIGSRDLFTESYVTTMQPASLRYDSDWDSSSERFFANDASSYEHDKGYHFVPTWEWARDPYNPYNWPTRKKMKHLAMVAASGFLS
jgi:hypothetical protein